jgi:hypothetical protein
LILFGIFLVSLYFFGLPSQLMNIPHTLRLSTLALALALASCATSTPNAIITAPLTAVIGQGDGVNTTVTTSDSRMSEEECQMLGNQITQNVQSMAQTPAGAPNSYELAVNITRYSRGNGLVRTALPGMGQIRLHGTVTVYQMPKRIPVGEFIINKSFFVGGLYGVSVNMNTIANTFAQAVAKTVCQTR